MDVRRGKERIVKTVMGRYTREQLQKEFGLKSPVVQGFHDVLDLNKLIRKITPEQIKKLKEKQLNGNYGMQQDETIRDVLLKSKELTKSFMDLPAIVREKFSNDEFLYQDFLENNKDNKYALAELFQELSGSEEVKRMIEKSKMLEEAQKEIELNKQKELGKAIAEALKANQAP